MIVKDNHIYSFFTSLIDQHESVGPYSGNQSVADLWAMTVVSTLHFLGNRNSCGLTSKSASLIVGMVHFRDVLIYRHTNS